MPTVLACPGTSHSLTGSLHFPAMPQALSKLRTLPYPAQIAAIDVELRAGHTTELLRELSSYRDYQPLAYALFAMAATGELARVALDLVPLLLSIPDTGIRRVLRALDKVASPPAFIEALANGAWTLPIERVAAVAMIDRWLKNTAPTLQAENAKAGLEHCISRLTAGDVDGVLDRHFMRLPGASLGELSAIAEQAGAGERWQVRLHDFAKRVLDVLESQPKSLSQANAEELLSRQVYTDPGHFLVELLQNADDAGATLWQVQIFDDRIEVEHDGTPFDALDVVGILSIGQTTKSKEQIGFFGVGFKSVYEICERPQLYSGVFSLEIADVSIPRALRPLPDLAAGRTRLVLPLRTGHAESVSPEALYQTLEDLPEQVVLTLNSIRELRLRFGNKHRHVRGQDESKGRFCLQDGQRSKRYLVERGEARYEGLRGSHRAHSTPVLVAMALDDRGRPTPVGDGPTMYSYLPTQERSGLRILVHAHFDLPVDRERLDLSSEWNRWALGCAGDLLCCAVARLIEEHRAGDVGADEALDALTTIISLPSELGHSAFAALAAPLSTLAFLPGADGLRYAAQATLVSADPRLLTALAEVPLQFGRRLLRRLGDRETQVALLLGSCPLEIESVVEKLAEAASILEEGAPLDTPWSPHMAMLAVALTDAEADLSPLAELPCLPDSTGRAHSPKSLLRADARLRTFIAPIRRLVREDLEQSSCAAFLDALRVPVARIRDLVERCIQPDAARMLIDHVGAGPLLQYLREAPRGELEFLPFARIIPGSRGELIAVGEVWLTKESELGTLIRGALKSPPIAHLETEKLLSSTLTDLGCRTIELRDILAMLEDEQLQFHNEQFVPLHQAIDRLSHCIDPALARILTRAKIFPVRGGGRAALVGPNAASIPFDEALTELWPSRSWLSASVAQLPYLRTLAVPIVGPTDLATRLINDGAAAAFDRSSVFAYLANHPETLSPKLVEHLVAACLWPDLHGTLHPLDQLRRAAEHPSVSALYEVWPRAMTVEEGSGPGTALHLASALGVAHRIVIADLNTAIADLRQTRSDDLGPFRDTEDLNSGDPAVVDIVHQVLLDAANTVPRATLRSICDAPIFLCTDGKRRRLGNAAERSRARALRVHSQLAAAFSALGFSILEQGEADALGRVLDALDMRPATVTDLVIASARDGISVGDETARLLRDALCSDVSKLSALDDAVRAELASLAIWPCDDGLVHASGVLRTRSLDDLLQGTGIDVQGQLSDQGLPILHSSAEAAAEVLSSQLDFANPAELLAALLVKVAIVDAPVEEQTPLLSEVGKVGTLAAALVHQVEEPWSLPVSVNTNGTLVARQLVLASPEEHRFSRGLGLHSELAASEWADAVEKNTPSGLPHLSPRRVLDALREVSGAAVVPDDHACLAEEGSRKALYRWLLLHREAIALDEQSLGLLGTSAVILSGQGVLQSPRDLLFDDALPDLGIDWNPSPEVPQELRDWLRHMFRPATKQLRPVIDHMLDAIDRAAEGGDAPRIGEILEHMARLLRADRSDGELEEFARRFKLRKRLRVQTEDGQIEYARRLLAGEPLDADLVPRFAKSPPPSASQGYRHPEVLRLLRASGADDELGIAALQRFLGGEGLLEERDATLALACYVANAANRRASLRHDLDLRRRSWIPDQLGNTHSPDTLYWPTQELEMLIGDHAHLYVHSELALRAPEIRDWLPLREPGDAKLADISAHLAFQASQGIPAGEEALVWLDSQLSENRIEKKAVGRALRNIPMLVDDQGQMRRATELLVSGGRQLFGDRRGNWSTGTRLKKLAAALGISKSPTKSDVLAFLDQAVHREFLANPEALQADRELCSRLPRCLDMLVEFGGRGPAFLPVATVRNSQVVIQILPDPTVTIGLPGDAVNREFVILLADGADTALWRGYLRAYGVGPEARGTTAATKVRPPRPLPEIREAPTRASESEGQEDTEGPGIISRLRNWFRTSDEDKDDPNPDEEGRTARKPGSGTNSPERGRGNGQQQGSSSGASQPQSPDSSAANVVDQRSWFRGDRSLTSQLSSNAGWLADRMHVAEFGLAHAPQQLPLPHRYAPVAVFAEFDKRRQRWMPMAAEAQWRTGGAPAGRLHLRGKLPSPEAIIPMPLYGHLIDHTSDSEVRIFDGKGAAVLLSKGDPIVGLTIGLSAAPNFTNATAATGTKQMLQSSVADRELPEEVHDLVASLEREESALHIAGVISAFVKKRYAYDPTYLEDPQMAAWLRERSQGRSNTHIAALHAGGDAQHLGRGVCYELNALVCELLRRAGVPAAVATGWTFDRGHIDEPDHLWAMALLQSSDGPRWLPVDASTTRRGRPLHAAHRPPGPWRADKRKAHNVEQPDWDVQVREHQASDALPISDLLRVARYLERTTGRHLGTRGEILAASRELLSDPQKSAALADFLREPDDRD